MRFGASSRLRPVNRTARARAIPGKFGDAVLGRRGSDLCIGAMAPTRRKRGRRFEFRCRARQEALSTAVSRLLVQNNESEEQAALRIGQIYDRVQRQVYLFLTATLIAILFTSLYLIRSNRRLFAQLAALSEQRSELAQKLIATQESTLRHISRELHDEFGQILTAMGIDADACRESGPGGLGAALRTAGSL